MEHRWGWRVATDLAVQWADSARHRRIARMRDISVSGAFLEVANPPDLMTRVWIRFAVGPNRFERVEAYVVRASAGGCGLEWMDLAPGQVQKLMEDIAKVQSSAEVVPYSLNVANFR